MRRALYGAGPNRYTFPSPSEDPPLSLESTSPPLPGGSLRPMMAVMAAETRPSSAGCARVRFLLYQPALAAFGPR